MSSENNVPQGAISCEVHDELDSLRPKGGYTVLQEHTFKCNECNASLVKIMVIKETKEVNRIKVKCACGGESFIKKFNGKLMTCPCSGFTISDVQIAVGHNDKHKDQEEFQTIEVIREKNE